MVSKMVSKLMQRWWRSVPFLEHLFWGLGALQAPIGSLPEPLMIVLGASETWEILFLHWKIILVVDVFLGALKLLMCCLGPSWPLLSRVGPEMDPKKDLEILSFLWENIFPAPIPFFTTFVDFPFSLHSDPYQPWPEGSKTGPIFVLKI